MPNILKIPPEMFPVVASHLPLQHLPPTLSALARTCSNLYSYVQPILYRTVVINNEDDTFQMLQRILADPSLGLLVRELHIRIDLSVEIHKERGRTTLLLKLQEAIENGSFSRLNFFNLGLIKIRAPREDDESDFNNQYYLPRRFWENLRRCCPNLRGVCMDGVDDSPEDPWVNEPEFCDLKDFQGLSTTNFIFDGYVPEEPQQKRPLNIINLASSLQSLTLRYDGYPYQDSKDLFSLTFPHLKSLSFSAISLGTSTDEEAMAFWARHSNLERLCVYTLYSGGWFSDRAEAGLLPKLSHLRVQYEEAKALATHLPQLEHLSISYSRNHQVPYLLRSVIQDGLPKLRSLEVHQVKSTDQDIRMREGAMWHETEDGEFHQVKTLKKAGKDMDHSFVNSIVRGAPNLEELCLHGYPLPMDKLNPILGRLKSLERLYYRAFHADLKSIEQPDMDNFLLRCRLLGDSCLSLRTVTDISFYKNGPYLKGTIIRGHGGVVEGVIPGCGFGMEFTGGVDDPFPLNAVS